MDVSAVRANITKHLRPNTWDGKFEFTREAAGEALRLVASEKRFHPVRDYLEALKWDGLPRIATLPHDVLRIPAAAPWHTLSRALVRRWLIAAVARAMQPGCKVDTVLILCGPQGKKKSTFFAALGAGWFTDSPVDM